MAAIAGSLRYDLVRANALKVICTLAFTGVALAVFIVRDQVWWVPGLILAAGSIVGAQLAVKTANGSLAIAKKLAARVTVDRITRRICKGRRGMLRKLFFCIQISGEITIRPTKARKKTTCDAA